jgi:hypothetical protein
MLTILIVDFASIDDDIDFELEKVKNIDYTDSCFASTDDDIDFELFSKK